MRSGTGRRGTRTMLQTNHSGCKLPQKTPHYSLNDVRDAVRTGRVSTPLSVQKDYTNLGYFEENVVACCLALREENFIKTVTYDDDRFKIKCDEYLIDFPSPSGNIDSLYVKLRVSSSWVWLHSFHLRRR